MSITADLLRGNTDIILLARLSQSDSYGYEINKEISEITDGAFEIKEATLYSAFRRLEKNGLIESYWGNQQTGARRRYYKITPSGSAQLQTMVAEWEDATRLIGKLIKGETDHERTN
ncbi:MAG TPA: PadR family transcriptional regulator [Clostridiaceae bacterium]|nr:PadR family transcriptional regulator [Clostridiaceae bacterium]